MAFFQPLFDEKTDCLQSSLTLASRVEVGSAGPHVELRADFCAASLRRVDEDDGRVAVEVREHLDEVARLHRDFDALPAVLCITETRGNVTSDLSLDTKWGNFESMSRDMFPTSKRRIWPKKTWLTRFLVAKVRPILSVCVSITV